MDKTLREMNKGTRERQTQEVETSFRWCSTLPQVQLFLKSSTLCVSYHLVESAQQVFPYPPTSTAFCLCLCKAGFLPLPTLSRA